MLSQASRRYGPAACFLWSGEQRDCSFDLLFSLFGAGRVAQKHQCTHAVHAERRTLVPMSCYRGQQAA